MVRHDHAPPTSETTLENTNRRLGVVEGCLRSDDKQVKHFRDSAVKKCLATVQFQLSSQQLSTSSIIVISESAASITNQQHLAIYFCHLALRFYTLLIYNSSIIITHQHFSTRLLTSAYA